MTDRPARRPRRSRRALRVWAWIAGGLAFLAPWAALGLSPKPAAAEASGGRAQRPVVIVRKITRRVIVKDQPAQQPVQYVYVGGGSAPSGGSTGSGPVAAPAPAPAPTTTTSGS
jgi:hypothetical protein